MAIGGGLGLALAGASVLLASNVKWNSMTLCVFYCWNIGASPAGPAGTWLLFSHERQHNWPNWSFLSRQEETFLPWSGEKLDFHCFSASSGCGIAVCIGWFVRLPGLCDCIQRDPLGLLYYVPALWWIPMVYAIFVVGCCTSFGAVTLLAWCFVNIKFAPSIAVATFDIWWSTGLVDRWEWKGSCWPAWYALPWTIVRSETNVLPVAENVPKGGFCVIENYCRTAGWREPPVNRCKNSGNWQRLHRTVSTCNTLF